MPKYLKPMGLGAVAWLRGMATRISFGPFRVVAYVLHATGLDYVYKPRFLLQHAALLELDDATLDGLPKYSYTISGAKGDPINLVLVSHESDLKRLFRAAGWRRANPASPIHVLYGLFKALLKRPYETGPFAPLYVNIALQDLAYQQATSRRNFGERHHLRIWRTGLVLSDHRRVWVAAAGFENGMRLGLAAPFYTHALDPDIDKEREYVVRSLEQVGARRIKSAALRPAVEVKRPARNAHSSQYYTDGKAVVVEL